MILSRSPQVAATMPYCLVSFGSNLGDRRQRIAAAARRLHDWSATHSLRASRLYETPAIGGPADQASFLNAVALLETSATAHQLLGQLQRLEMELGRQRSERWDARSIDLDVVLYGDLIGNNLQLNLPHPRYTARTFVLTPASEVVPQWRDPRFGWTIAQLSAHLARGVPSIALVGGGHEMRRRLCTALAEQGAAVALTERPAAVAIGVIGNAPAVLPSPERPEALPPVADPGGRPWVAAYLPPLPPKRKPEAQAADDDLPAGSEQLPYHAAADDPGRYPRLVARLEWTTPESRWPAPHQIWRNGWDWPEYRLEVDDFDWAVRELAGALQSMACPLTPLTDDGAWF